VLRLLASRRADYGDGAVTIDAEQTLGLLPSNGQSKYMAGVKSWHLKLRSTSFTP